MDMLLIALEPVILEDGDESLCIQEILSASGIESTYQNSAKVTSIYGQLRKLRKMETNIKYDKETRLRYMAGMLFMFKKDITDQTSRRIAVNLGVFDKTVGLLDYDDHLIKYAVLSLFYHLLEDDCIKNIFEKTIVKHTFKYTIFFDTIISFINRPPSSNYRIAAFQLIYRTAVNPASANSIISILFLHAGADKSLFNIIKDQDVQDDLFAWTLRVLNVLTLNDDCDSTDNENTWLKIINFHYFLRLGVLDALRFHHEHGTDGIKELCECSIGTFDNINYIVPLQENKFGLFLTFLIQIIKGFPEDEDKCYKEQFNNIYFKIHAVRLLGLFAEADMTQRTIILQRPDILRELVDFLRTQHYVAKNAVLTALYQIYVIRPLC